MVIKFNPGFPIDCLAPNNGDAARGSVAFPLRKLSELDAHTLESNRFSGFLKFRLVTSRK